MNKIAQIILVVLFFNANSLIAQKTTDNKLSETDIAAFEGQARQLVSFMEFAFNTLGSSKADYKDKHTIIDQSFLKFFKDDKVQIEDDLVEKRDMVTHKDVQAYLKDIDFFYKNVTFKYTVEEITNEINDSGESFFKVKASRNMKGTTLEGKQMNDNRTRYIELNVDPVKRDLKIVSIYTTKSNEEEELIAWWNNLDNGWRDFLSGSSYLDGTYPLKDIIRIEKDFIVVKSANSSDTIRMRIEQMLNEIRRILRADQLVLTNVPKIYNLNPLGAFNVLKHLDISKAKVPSLEPIRNLSKIETLIARQSLINSLEPIRYMPVIRILDISETSINDITPLEEFENLEVLIISESNVSILGTINQLVNLRELKISGLEISNLDFLSNLINLEVLELSGLPITSLKPIEGLSKLKRLAIDDTNIEDLSPLAGLESLENITLDNTDVKSLKPLEKLPNLKLIYSDKTLISKSDALSFMQAHPGVKVIYESQELMGWWETMDESWRQVFGKIVKLSENPSREELHEISYIKAIDISGNSTISNLDPLEKLASLRELNISQTNVSTLEPISGLFDLQSIQLANTKIKNLGAIESLSGIQQIDFSNTEISSIFSLVKLPNLRLIKMDSTPVDNLHLLIKMKRLEVLYADGIDSLKKHLPVIWDSIPEILVINQTKALQGWWGGLPKEWKDLFKKYESVSSEIPTREELHRIASLKEIELSKTRGINSIAPLTTLQQLSVLNISNMAISDLSPLKNINRLVSLDVADTPVSDLTALGVHKRLKELNCANTQISNIDVVLSLPELRKLNISGTQVSKLNALMKSSNLEELDCFNTRISSLKPIEKLPNLEVLRVYNTKLNAKKVDKFKEFHPEAEVVFY